MKLSPGTLSLFVVAVAYRTGSARAGYVRGSGSRKLAVTPPVLPPPPIADGCPVAGMCSMLYAPVQCGDNICQYSNQACAASAGFLPEDCAPVEAYCSQGEQYVDGVRCVVLTPPTEGPAGDCGEGEQYLEGVGCVVLTPPTEGPSDDCGEGEQYLEGVGCVVLTPQTGEQTGGVTYYPSVITEDSEDS